MNNFETMPLRFRVWDKEKKCFHKKYGAIPNEKLSFSPLTEAWEPEFYEEDEGPEKYIVSQDTGLKDKDGKSIYTGDIVEWERHSLKQKNRYIRGVIVYKFAHICMEVKTTAGKKEYAPIWGILPDLKIISSIWQNPELLEEK